MNKSSEFTKTLELHDDAWQRFERAVGVVAKSPPQHRSKKTPKKKQWKRSRRTKAPQKQEQ
jgi:hypothetical protein